MAGAGFPVTISKPGSYKLCENLVVPDANTTAIEVGSSTTRQWATPETASPPAERLR